MDTLMYVYVCVYECITVYKGERLIFVYSIPYLLEPFYFGKVLILMRGVSSFLG